MTKNAIYFGAGPTTLPRDVLDGFSNQSFPGHQCELRFYELSHRHPLSRKRQAAINALFRSIFNIPEQYHVLFLAGGARHQYEQLLLNFAHQYSFSIIESGHWARSWANTIEQFSADCLSRILVDTHQSMPLRIKPARERDMMFTVLNETVDGLALPLNIESHPCVVADATSQMGFRPVNVSDFQMLFMQTSKAMGVAGMTIVVLHQDLMDQADPNLLPLQSYQAIAKHDSLYSTPPLICMDVLWHMLCWMESQGGMPALADRQLSRAMRVYAIIDQNSHYVSRVPISCRSLQNICFDVVSGLDLFIDAAEKNGLFGLRGHSAVGGVRINLYHGIDDDAFERLIDFLNHYGDKV